MVRKILMIIIAIFTLAVLSLLIDKQPEMQFEIVIEQEVPINYYEDKIIVNKSRKKLYLYKEGVLYEYDIATGKNIGDKQKVGDNRTPIGEFKIVSIEKSDKWTYDFEDDGLGPIAGAYGPWFLRLDGKWSGIGIHGTHDETTIGKDDTHGCIRMRNNELEELKSKVSIDYLVEIIE
jgi:lipoprotein-anchoring transpeptidase ErfK/SrfK